MVFLYDNYVNGIFFWYFVFFFNETLFSGAGFSHSKRFFSKEN